MGRNRRRSRRNPWGLGPDRSPRSCGELWLERYAAAERIRDELAEGDVILEREFFRGMHSEVYELVVRLLGEEGLVLREAGDGFLRIDPAPRM